MAPGEWRDYIRNVYLPQRKANLQAAVAELEQLLVEHREELRRLEGLKLTEAASISRPPAGAIPFCELEMQSWFRRSPEAPRLYQKVDDHHCVTGGARLRMRPLDWVFPAD